MRETIDHCRRSGKLHVRPAVRGCRGCFISIEVTKSRKRDLVTYPKVSWTTVHQTLPPQSVAKLPCLQCRDCNCAMRHVSFLVHQERDTGDGRASAGGAGAVLPICRRTRARTGMASQSRQAGQASDRIRSDAPAVWLANRHAPSAKLERRPLGGTISSAKPEDSSSDTLLSPEHVGRADAFIKKTQKTPPEDLELAKRRWKEVTH